MKITITDVHTRYGTIVALDGPSFEIPSGSTFGVLGPNGAGKTTLFELLVGHDRPDHGSIMVGGIDVETAGHQVRERVAFLPEHAGFPAALTGREVLEVHTRMRGLQNADGRIDTALETVGLSDAADRAVEGYSNGMGRRLGLAATLIGEQPVLVLDEPTAGLDPRGVATFHDIIERIDRETDATVVLSSHVLSEIERLCDEVAILENGELRLRGSVDELRTGDVLTVVIYPDGDPSQLRAAVRAWGDVSKTNGRIEVTCASDDAFDLLSTIDASLIDRFEVRESGLEAAFHDAIASREDRIENGASGGRQEVRVI